MTMSYVVHRKIHEPTNEKVVIQPLVTIPDDYWVLPEIQIGYQLARNRGMKVQNLRIAGRSSNEIRVFAPDLNEHPCAHHKVWVDEQRDALASEERVTRRETFTFVRKYPFGAVRWRTEDGKRVGGLEFRCARQIHKGELGRHPKLQMPHLFVPGFLQSPALPTAEYYRNSWARLDHVAALISLAADELLLRYFDFGCKEIRHLAAIVATQERMASTPNVPFHRYYEDTLGYLFCCDPAEVWLRRSFVRDVLNLHAFGYVSPL